MPKKHKIFILLFFSILFSISASNNAYAENISNEPVYKNNQILVKFKKDPTKIYDSFLNDFANNHNLVYQPNKSTTDNSERSHFLFETSDSTPIKDLINIIKKDTRVKNVQPNYLFKPAKKVKSSQDSLFDREWWLYNNGKIGTAGSDIYLLSVWEKEQENWPGVVIGIIDTGLNQKHKDLKKNIVQGYDFVHNRKKKMTDKDGHGSFIAGLIASQVNNRKGIAGLSRLDRLKVMPLKFDFSTDQAISAIALAQAKGIRILNVSWGTEEYDQALYDGIRAYNGLVISAAGNEGVGHNENNHFYPCDFDLENIICVGASDENDRITDYSDFGENVDILAPGGSEEAPLISFDTKTNRYIEGLGTSFATAFVSGAAGLVLSANPSISNLEIKNLILNNARKKEELAEKVSSKGLLNIKAAVNRETGN